MSQTHLEDSFGRKIRDLRISVTERCNFRCSYCKPLSAFSEKYKAHLMTFEEIERISRIFVSLGVEKIRLTGGEPLLRKDMPSLVQKLSSLEGLQDLAMTTNAFFLEQKAQELKDHGLHRLTISLDSLQPDRFHEMTSTHSFDKVMRGIQKASEVGFAPLKINMVVMKGVNEDEIPAFAHFARETGHNVRFIEFMPLDSGKTWERDQVFSRDEIVASLRSVAPLKEIERSYSSETASRYVFEDGLGSFGIISAVTANFCGQCSRIRLTADGKIRNCLFSHQEFDLLEKVRAGASDEEIEVFLREVVWQKEVGHQINQPHFKFPERSMSMIGG